MTSLSIALHFTGALLLAQPLIVLPHGAMARPRYQNVRKSRSAL